MASWAFRKKVQVPHKMVRGLHKKVWEPHTTVQETHKMEKEHHKMVKEHHKRRKEHHSLSLECRSLTMGLHMMTREIRRIHSGELALNQVCKMILASFWAFLSKTACSEVLVYKQALAYKMAFLVCKQA